MQLKKQGQKNTHDRQTDKHGFVSNKQTTKSSHSHPPSETQRRSPQIQLKSFLFSSLFLFFVYQREAPPSFFLSVKKEGRKICFSFYISSRLSFSPPSLLRCLCGLLRCAVQLRIAVRALSRGLPICLRTLSLQRRRRVGAVGLH